MRYAAPASCPDVEGYLSDVRARAAHVTLEAAGDSDPRSGGAVAAEASEAVMVRIEPAPNERGWLGYLTMTGTLALDREVRGERCEEVVAALALITVLRLEGTAAGEPDTSRAAAGSAGAASGSNPSGARDPDAAAPGAVVTRSGASSSSAQGESPALAPPEPAAPAVPSTSAPVGRARPEEADGSGRAEALDRDVTGSAANGRREAEPGAAGLEAVTPGEAVALAPGDDTFSGSSRSSEPELPEVIAREGTEEPAGTSAQTNESLEASWQWPATSVDVAVLAGYATVPSQAFRAALGGELRIGEGTSAWMTSLSLEYARGKAPRDLAPTLLTVDLALCPPEFISEPSVWISACASARAGWVRFAFAEPQPGLNAFDKWRPWLAVGPSLRAGVPVSERWALRGVAQLALQLVRDTVGIDDENDPTTPPERIYRPPAYSLELGVGIGYSF